ncbi:MAG TPA: ABC transporter ATP-binding protein [Candidatus Limnocylindrales bacterium]|nr:ABC transporter ATP-binding protein [Candidatus Limnocylindrales bacterium]
MTITVSDVSFSYGERIVLDHINVTASEGQLLSVVGPNGVGKSTLFYCMLGLLNTFKGQIKIDDKDIKRLGIKEMAKLVAYIPQSHYPSFNFSVFDMVLMGTTNQVRSISTPGKKQLMLVEEALDRMKISHLRARGYTQISGGERQLVLIARALVQQTKNLIFDEPTANLDFGNQILVLSQIKSLVNEGYTIIQSTHNPEHTFMFSDCVLAIHDGRVLASGAPSTIVTKELMQKLYSIDVEVESLYQDKVRVCIPAIVVKNGH